MKKSRANLLLCISIALVLMLTITSCTGDVDENPQDQNEDNAQDQNEDNTQDQNEDESQTEGIDIEETALSFVNDLLDEKYDDVYKNYGFDQKMKQAINPTILMQIRGQLNQGIGEFVDITEIQHTTNEPYDIISVICEFEKDYLSLNVVFDQEKQIAGFNFTEAKGFEKVSEDSQDNMASNIEEQEVVVGEGEWALPGTLALPKGEGPFPVVVLVHGSGPNDRDETMGPNKPFRDIAWGLASEGIAVLRYEKRTKEHGVKIMGILEDFTVEEETIDDALSAVELLRNHSFIDEDEIYVLGHSLGGYLIPRIGVKDEEVAGFIILAGPTRPLEDIMVEQYEYLSALDGNVTDEEQQNIDSVKVARDSIKNLNPEESSDSTMLLGVGAKYWLDLRDYSPIEMVKELNRPILLLQGERDYQVTMENFQNWKDALSKQNNATFESFEKLNHLFMSGEGAPNPEEYFVGNNVSQEVIDYISQWIIN